MPAPVLIRETLAACDPFLVTVAEKRHEMVGKAYLLK